MTDPRLSPDVAVYGPAVAATRTRCRGCYADIVQPRPGGRWYGQGEGVPAGVCTGRILHEPLPSPLRGEPCSTCGRPWWPHHAAGAPGPTVRHPYRATSGG